jgi:hypothetical protein
MTQQMRAALPRAQADELGPAERPLGAPQDAGAQPTAPALLVAAPAAFAPPAAAPVAPPPPPPPPSATAPFGSCPSFHAACVAAGHAAAAAAAAAAAHPCPPGVGPLPKRTRCGVIAVAGDAGPNEHGGSPSDGTPPPTRATRGRSKVASASAAASGRAAGAGGDDPNRRGRQGGVPSACRVGGRRKRARSPSSSDNTVDLTADTGAVWCRCSHMASLFACMGHYRVPPVLHTMVRPFLCKCIPCRSTSLATSSTPAPRSLCRR